ncbi:MAG: epoxyqueuosine reductase [Clostridiales bacterium]|nr:epoxyqueuosine reductase [Clostridiales bacterium]
MDLLKQRLVEYGRDLGFDLIRMTTAEPLELWHAQTAEIIANDPESAIPWANIEWNPKAIMPEANSLLVAVLAHKPLKAGSFGGSGRLSSHYREYPKGRKAAGMLKEFLVGIGHKAIVDPPLPVKEIAHRAGVGHFGKNSLIHTKDYGSWISIHIIITDAALTPDGGKDTISDCPENCNLCIKACPTGALRDDGQLIADRCMRHHMLSSDFVPVDMREEMGNRILGCDICQAVCPLNKQGLSEATFPEQEVVDLFNIGDILAEYSTGLKKRMKAMAGVIGSNYARAQKILSMAAIIAGNSGDRIYIPSLIQLLSHPHPPIRGHSAWAIGKIAPGDYTDILTEALDRERDNRVKEEINNAIKA